MPKQKKRTTKEEFFGEYGVLLEDMRDDIKIIVEGIRTINDRQDRMEARLDRIEERLDKVEARIAALEFRFDHFEKEVKEIRQTLKDKVEWKDYVALEKRVEILEKQLARTR